jgi:hypothetical protein
MALFLLFGVLPLAVIVVAVRLTIPSSSTDVAPTRVVRPPLPVGRPARLRATRRVNDDEARAILMRDGFSVDQSPIRKGPPRTLDSARYDIWRQVR